MKLSTVKDKTYFNEMTDGDFGMGNIWVNALLSGLVLLASDQIAEKNRVLACRYVSPTTRLLPVYTISS